MARCPIKFHAERTGFGQHPEPLHPVRAAEHRVWGGLHREEPEGKELLTRHTGTGIHYIE